MISRREDTQVFRFRRILRCDFACGCPFFAPCGTFWPRRCDFCRPAARRCTFCIFFVHLHDISTGMSEQDNIIKEIEGREYKYGFTSDIETETIPRGLSEEVVRLISAKKGEPEWMTATGSRWSRRRGRTSAFRRSISRTSSITLRPGCVPNWAPWTRSTPNSNARSTSWASPWRSRCSWRAWPSMPSWTPCRSRPLSRRRSPRRESSSVRSRRRSATIPISSRNTWAAWCPAPTTTMRRSTRRSSPTGRSATFPKGCAVRWSCRPTSASMPRVRDSSNARSSSPTKGPT